MKTRKLTALILSVLMIISIIPISVFALPSTVTVSDSLQEHVHIEEDEDSTLSTERTLEVILYDSYGDGWNGASLAIKKGDELVAELTIEEGDTSKEKTVAIEGYNDWYTYSFVWTEGTFDGECNFEVVIDGESIFVTTNDELNDAITGDVVYVLDSRCAHSIPEDSLVCSVCSQTCGKDFSHSFAEDSICTFCKTVCGSESSPHDWSNKDGVCADCKKECTHSFAYNTCTICDFLKPAYVTAGTDTTYYLTIEEAIKDAAKTEGSTLYLNDNIYEEDIVTIDSGKFTLDLNSHNITIKNYYLEVTGTAELIINGPGTIDSEASGLSLYVKDSSKVTIKGGYFDDVVVVSGSGCNLIIEDGEFGSNIEALNGKITVSGGRNKYTIAYFGGSIVFEKLDTIENISIYNANETALSTSSITLPDGYIICDLLNFELQEIEGFCTAYVCKKETLPNGLYILAGDTVGDTWNNSMIEIYKEGTEEDTLVETVEIDEDVSKQSFELDYDPANAYKFKWITGEFDTECYFAIYLNGLLKYKTYNAGESFATTDTDFLRLDALCQGHEFEEGSSVCKLCSYKCSHSFGSDSVCDICAFECGTQTNPHSYDNGTCTICEQECTHDFSDNVCTACSLVRYITVNTGTKTYYFDNIYSAISLSSECPAAVLTLYDDIDLCDNGASVASGSLTIDLNGHTIISTVSTFDVVEEAEVIICDSSKTKTGRIETTNKNGAAAVISENASLTLNGGTLHTAGATTVHLLTGEGEFVMNAGTVSSAEGDSEVILTNGSLVHLKGGSIDGFIIHGAGTVSFEGHPNPAGIEVRNKTGEDKKASDYFLPEGCYFTLVKGDTTAVSDILHERIYYVGGTADIYVDIGEITSAENTRSIFVNGTQDTTYDVVNNSTYNIIGVLSTDILLEVVEREKDNTVATVKTQYFFVDAETRVVTALDSLSDYMGIYDETQVRAKDHEGLRFLADVSTKARDEKDSFVIDEYGFIVASVDNLGTEQLTLDFSNYAKGVAYTGDGETDIVYDNTDDEWYIFTGVLVNIPVEHYKTDVVCRTYTKITIDGSQFVIYGQIKSGNLYDTANELLKGDPQNTDLLRIVEDYDKFLNGAGDNA